jgi:hypothetical protein
MFDALLYCQVVCHVMADIRHGYFLIVADFVRAIMSEFRALWAASLRAMAARRTRHTPVVCRPRDAWLQSLARLETYVDSMA